MTEALLNTSDSGAIMTCSGRWINPLNPDPEQINIEDIAHSLSNQCRFTGHTKHFYSVAQHSCLVADLCGYAKGLGGLLHDGTEAYMSDIARPIKSQPGFGEIYKEVEGRLMGAINIHFGLGWDYVLVNDKWVLRMPEEIKRADNIPLKTEMRDLLL